MSFTKEKNQVREVFTANVEGRAREELASIDTSQKESAFNAPQTRTEAFTVLHASGGLPELPDGRISGTSWLQDGVLNGVTLLTLGFLAGVVGAPFASAVIMLSGFAFVIGRLARQMVSRENKLPVLMLNMAILWGAFQIFGLISLFASITPFAAVAIPYIVGGAMLGVLDPFSLVGYLYRRYIKK